MLNQPVQSWKRYGAAVISVAVAVSVRAALSSLLGSNVPYVTLFPAIIFSALYGGYRAGILATLFSASAVVLWIDPVYSFKFDNPADDVGFILFLSISSLIIWLCESSTRASSEAAAVNHKNTIILESVSDAFFAVDFEWCFTYVNASAERFLGKERNYLLGRNLWETFPQAKGSIFDKLYHKAMNEKMPVSFEAPSTINRKWIEVNVYPSADGLSVYSRDITARKDMEKEREEFLERESQAREAAESANLLKDEFLATVSHELRTPLNSILGWASMAKGDNFPPENYRRTLEIIERNARSQNKIIEDILDVSRIITGKFNLHMSSVKLMPVIENSLESVRPAAEAKRIKLRTRIEQRSATVHGDFDRLQQVLWNLLSNAVKFTSEGGQIDVHLKKSANNFEISVSDSGAGIEPEFLPYVFERFRQAEGGTNRKYGGLGLGLAIVRHITELHGGTVSVMSEGKGAGSTFTVSLPVENRIAEAVQSTSLIHKSGNTADDEASAKLSGLRILVVDDEPEARELVGVILGKYGAEVVTAESVADALAKMRENFPDVLVSDIGMPVSDGFDLIKQIRQLYPQAANLKTIALTAYARKEDEQRALSEGFHYHLAKPLEISKLLKVMTKTVD